MRWTRIAPVLMFAMLLGGPGRLAAQSTGSSGMFGNRTTGNGITAGTSSAFGSNSPLSNLGQGGQGTPSLNNPNGVGGQARQAGSFVGANTGQAAQQNFVGASQANPAGAGQAGAGNFGGGMGMSSFGMGALVGRRMAQGNFGSGANGNTTTTTPQVRTTFTLGPELTMAVPAPVNSAIAEHLMALPALHWQGPVQVEMRGHTAILRGVAASEHDRDLAERVVRLEATVERVQNQIAIAGQVRPRTWSPEVALPQEQAPKLERTPTADSSAAGNSAVSHSATGNSAVSNSATGNFATGSSAARSSAAGSSAVRSSAPHSSAPALSPRPRAPASILPPLPTKPVGR